MKNMVIISLSLLLAGSIGVSLWTATGLHNERERNEALFHSEEEHAHQYLGWQNADLIHSDGVLFQVRYCKMCGSAQVQAIKP